MYFIRYSRSYVVRAKCPGVQYRASSLHGCVVAYQPGQYFKYLPGQVSLFVISQTLPREERSQLFSTTSKDVSGEKFALKTNNGSRNRESLCIEFNTEYFLCRVDPLSC